MTSRFKQRNPLFVGFTNKQELENFAIVIRDCQDELIIVEFLK